MSEHELSKRLRIKAYGLESWIEAEDGLPKNNHIILAHEIPRGAHGFQVVPFSEAIKKVRKPHPMTPNPISATPQSPNS